MEDAATAEISRSQLWQWVHHRVKLDDGTIVNKALVEAELVAEVDRLRAAGLDSERLATGGVRSAV